MEIDMASYTIKYNRTTNHIAGITERSKGSELDYARSACPSLSRSVRFALGKSTDDLAEALKSARTAGGRKICGHCESAAEAELTI
jgi:hypothetical protein